MVEFTGIRPKGQTAIVPATRFDLDILERVRPDKPFLATAIFKRSLQHLRWYRALVGVVAEAKGLHPDELHATLKFKAGLVERILLSQNGQPAVQLRSIAFHGENAMDEGEFTDYRILAVNLLFRDFLDPSDKKSVWKRVEELVGPCPW